MNGHKMFQKTSFQVLSGSPIITYILLLNENQKQMILNLECQVWALVKKLWLISFTKCKIFLWVCFLAKYLTKFYSPKIKLHNQTDTNVDNIQMTLVLRGHSITTWTTRIGTYHVKCQQLSTRGGRGKKWVKFGPRT